jgi:hypothetical protein
MKAGMVLCGESGKIAPVRGSFAGPELLVLMVMVDW